MTPRLYDDTNLGLVDLGVAGLILHHRQQAGRPLTAAELVNTARTRQAYRHPPHPDEDDLYNLDDFLSATDRLTRAGHISPDDIDLPGALHALRQWVQDLRCEDPGCCDQVVPALGIEPRPSTL